MIKKVSLLIAGLISVSAHADRRPVLDFIVNNTNIKDYYSYLYTQENLPVVGYDPQTFNPIVVRRGNPLIFRAPSAGLGFVQQDLRGRANAILSCETFVRSMGWNLNEFKCSNEGNLRPIIFNPPPQPPPHTFTKEVYIFNSYNEQIRTAERLIGVAYTQQDAIQMASHTCQQVKMQMIQSGQIDSGSYCAMMARGPVLPRYVECQVEVHQSIENSRSVGLNEVFSGQSAINPNEDSSRAYSYACAQAMQECGNALQEREVYLEFTSKGPRPGTQNQYFRTYCQVVR